MGHEHRQSLGVVLLVSVLNPLAPAQSNDRVQQTWKGPDVSTLWELLKDTGAKNARVDVLTFKPSGDSGVTKALADAIGVAILVFQIHPRLSF